MANIADPDQTAPEEQSDLGLHCLLTSICPSTENPYSHFFHQDVLQTCFVNVYSGLQTLTTSLMTQYHLHQMYAALWEGHLHHRPQGQPIHLMDFHLVLATKVSGFQSHKMCCNHKSISKSLI